LTTTTAYCASPAHSTVLIEAKVEYNTSVISMLEKAGRMEDVKAGGCKGPEDG
jgi:hypothetical protein